MFKAFLTCCFLGAFLIFSQAPWHYLFLIFLIFPLLFITIDSKIKNKEKFRRFYRLVILLGGFLYFYYLFGFSWIISAFEYKQELEAFKYVTLFGLPLLMVLFTLPSFLFPTLFWDNKISKCISLAACLSFGEYLRSNILSGFSWNIFSHSLLFNENIMQIFSITGQYLASFLLILSTQFILFFGSKKNLFYSLILISIIPLIFVFGFYKIDKNKFVEGKRIAIIQPNISQDDKIYKKDLFETISNLTELSRHENIDLTIWPESALPILLEQNKETINLIVKNISTDSQLLVGNITYRDNSFRNSALLINNKSNIQNIYNKVHLVPFGEFIPFKNFLSNIPFIKIISGDIGFEKGQDIELVDTSVGKSRVAICYEIIFPEEINPYNKDLDLIINITNDAWFGQSSGPYQHLNIARIRAIEQGVPVLRSANTGISALIDPYGRVIEKIDLNKRGSIVSLLPKKTKKTIYSIIGDYLFFGVLILSLLILFISKRRN